MINVMFIFTFIQGRVLILVHSRHFYTFILSCLKNEAVVTDGLISQSQAFLCVCHARVNLPSSIFKIKLITGPPLGDPDVRIVRSSIVTLIGCFTSTLEYKESAH